MKQTFLALLTCLMSCNWLNAGNATAKAPASPDLTFEEADGLVAVEAEHFFQQTDDDVRRWYLRTSEGQESVEPDGDPNHVAGASGGAYLEVLPDTRRTHDDKLIQGQNFVNQAGRMAVLSYNVYFNTPGRYYVWARTFSTGTEDNGLHVGIDGQWPGSGQRMQWTAKQKWYWDSKQRTQQVHTGVPGRLYLDVDKPGKHVISFSMREDGFEFDKWLMTREQSLDRPDGVGPASNVKTGAMPKAFAFVAAAPEQAPGGKPFPQHWGEPPRIQTRDLVTLPGGYGQGSSTLANWIQENLDRDAKQGGRETSAVARQPDGDGNVVVSGEQKQWHKITLSMSGPFAHERDNEPNPFTDYRLTVRFTHESGSPDYRVPGYFAADGNAANSSAEAGTIWRAHLSPDKPGKWNYAVSFVQGNHAALDSTVNGEPVALLDGKSGEFAVSPTDKTGRDFRGRGRLQYVGKHYLRFAESGEYFLKAGADAPETLLAYVDFDGTVGRKKNVPLKTWSPHVKDWNDGDPTWKDGKGKGLIGALNYLSGKGCNVFSFLTYNAGGDGDNVWPMVARDDKLHYDCSKLDQWAVVFDHATQRGLYLHFKLQETENDDNRRGEGESDRIEAALDGGDLGAERRLYCRELIARYGHELALNWNLGEENTQSTEQQQAMADYIHDTDPYDHHIVVHTFPGQQDKVYRPLLGKDSVFTGASLQNSHIKDTHVQTAKWVRESAKAGKPWVVAFDESGSAAHGQPPDLGYEGFDGSDRKGEMIYTQHEVRKQTLWGVLMAGGAGVEYYFGYQFTQNDLVCEDWRSRDQSWDYCRIALEFFRDHRIPFWEMTSADASDRK